MRVPSQRSSGKSRDSKRGVRAAQLRIDELLSYRHTGGIIRFAGERALLLDAVALGLLRKQLIESFGLLAARAILTQFGYSHGWRTADTLEHAVEWQSAREWRIAGGRLHRLQGMVTFEPVDPSARTGPEPFADAIWKDSYEAEQHVLHLGRAAESRAQQAQLAAFAETHDNDAMRAEVASLRMLQADHEGQPDEARRQAHALHASALAALDRGQLPHSGRLRLLADAGAGALQRSLAAGGVVGLQRHHRQAQHGLGVVGLVRQALDSRRLCHVSQALNPGEASTRYLIVALVGFAINSLWVWLCVRWMGFPTWSPLPLVLFVTPLLVFLLNRAWVFK